MTRKALIIGIVLWMSVFLTGCWNNKDLTELAISTGIGLDITDDGKVMLSVQIVKPSGIKSSSGKDSGGGSGGGKAFVVVTNTADTIYGALRGMLDRVNKRVFYSSSQVIVIGEKAAKSGINDFLDFLQRDHETQFKTQVVIARGVTAHDILQQEYDLSSVPASYLTDTLKNNYSRAFTKSTMLIDLVKEISSPDKQLTVGTVSKVGTTTSTEGLAVFKKDMLVGWLDRFDTRGYLFTTGNVDSTILEVENPSAPGHQVAIDLIRSKTIMHIEFENGMPVFNISIRPEGNIGEQEADGRTPEEQLIDKLAAECNKKIKNEVGSVISKCQTEYESDIFGFGELIHKNYSAYWKSVEGRWCQDIFPKITVNINVNTILLRSGLIKNTLEAK